VSFFRGGGGAPGEGAVGGDVGGGANSEITLCIYPELTPGEPVGLSRVEIKLTPELKSILTHSCLSFSGGGTA